MINKNLRILIAVVIGFVLLFLISLGSFYFLLLPKMNGNNVQDEQIEQRENGNYYDDINEDFIL